MFFIIRAHQLFLWTYNSIWPIPEVAVWVDNPITRWLYALLLFLHCLLASKHAQGEFVNSGLKHGTKLPLHVSLIPPGVSIIRHYLRAVLSFAECDRTSRLLTRSLSSTSWGVGERNSGVLFLHRCRLDLGPGPLCQGPRWTDCAIHACSLPLAVLRCYYYICLLLLPRDEWGEAPWTSRVPSTISVFVAYHTDGSLSYHACLWDCIPTAPVLWLCASSTTNSIPLAWLSGGCAATGTERRGVFVLQEPLLIVVGVFARNGRGSASWRKFLHLCSSAAPMLLASSHAGYLRQSKVLEFGLLFSVLRLVHHW